uniref:F-box domain-containing protein n=1 Tax=Oryza glumipatula TaxID=40148 RepID=A0A0E0AFD5_9ORYZ
MSNHCVGGGGGGAAGVDDLTDDLVAEILLRLRPSEPACLVRASAVCKPWRRILTDQAFLRRYRDFHGAPPLLGFLHNVAGGGEDRKVCERGYFKAVFPYTSFCTPGVHLQQNRVQFSRKRLLELREGDVAKGMQSNGKSHKGGQP